MSGKGQEQKKRNNPQQKKQEEIRSSSFSIPQNISNQEMIKLIDMEEEEEEEKDKNIEEEEKKEENGNSGGDNSGDGIPGGENPDPENNPDEENDDVLKEESGSGSDGDSDDDEHKEFEINTSQKKKAAGAPLNSSKILPSSKNGEESDDKVNIADEFETLADVPRIGKIFRKGRSIKNLIMGKDAPEAINAIREKYGLTKEEIKTGEAVPRMMDPYFRAAISNLSKDKKLNEKMRKELEDFSEEMDQQMMINTMKAPDDQQIANLEQYFGNNGDEKQLQRELKNKGLWKVFFGVEGIKSNLKSWMNGNPGNGIVDVIGKRDKELGMQKESARSLFKLFLLMQIGELKQRNTDKGTDRKNETDWKHNVSDLFAHGGRVMITTGEREEAGTQDLLSSIFSKTSALEKRSAATHYITDGKEEPGSLEEEKGNIAAIKGKWDSDWSNYGMPVAIGGSGNLGPDKQRAILNDNRNGHLYVGAREARKYKRGGILIGLESDAPYRMNHWGHYHTAKATPERIKSTGAMASDLHGDKTSGRNLHLRDIKNEDLITIMDAVDKEFDKLYGGERKEEYEGILQKITGKKLEQKELEKLLKDLTGLEELHIDLKKPILNKPILNKQEEIQPEEIESEDESWDDMFNPKGSDPWKDMATKPAGETETDEDIIKRDRFEVDLSRPDSTDKGKEFLENIEFPNDKTKELFEKNTEFQKLQEYLALKKKKETDGPDKLTEEEKEKIKKFENRKRFEVGDDKKQKDDKNPENEENEENPLKSEEIPSLNNYGPLLSEEEMDAIDPGAPDPDKEIIQERLEKEPLKQKGYVNEVGQEWLYDTDGSGKYYSAQADYTPDHFKNKETALDESIFEMLTGQSADREETLLKEIYNPFRSNEPETKEPEKEKIVEAAKQEDKTEQPKLTANTTENKPVKIQDLFGKTSEKPIANKEIENIQKEETKKKLEETKETIEKPIKKVSVKDLNNRSTNSVKSDPSRKVIKYDKSESLKDKPDSKQIRLQNILNPSDADLEKQPGGNNCYAFVAAALLRYYGKENGIKGPEKVKEQDILKQYGIEREGSYNKNSKKQGKLKKEFQYVTNKMSYNEQMSMGDIVEAIHDLSGGEAALNIKVISRAVTDVIDDDDKKDKESLKDTISYVVNKKNKPAGLLLGGETGKGHYILVTKTDDKTGITYRNSMNNPQKEQHMTWDFLFATNKHFQVCFLENTFKEPLNPEKYKDITQGVTLEKSPNEIRIEKKKEELKEWKKAAIKKNDYSTDDADVIAQKLLNDFIENLPKEDSTKKVEADTITANKKRVFSTESMDEHLKHIDYYLYNDGKHSYFSLRPKKKK